MSKLEDESLDAMLWACGYQPIGYQPLVRINDRLYELVRQQDEAREKREVTLKAMRNTFETLPLVRACKYCDNLISRFECVHRPGCPVGEQDEADRYYAEMVERMNERAPA